MGSRTFPVRRLAVFWGMLLLWPLVARPQEDPADWVQLLPTQGLAGWKHIIAEDATDDDSTWTRAGSDLICSGKPLGYLRTTSKHTNYILEFQWKYVEGENGNSGVLLHIQEPDRVWPSCFQVQMMNSEAGRIFPLGSASSGEALLKPGESLAKKVGEWNRWQIESRDGMISVRVERDGKWIAGSSLAVKEPTSGFIGFQSEESRVEFREVKIKALPAKGE